MCALIGLEVKRSYSSCSLLVIILETARRRPRWKSRFYKSKEVKSNTSNTKRLSYRDIAEHSINVFLTTQRLTALPVNVKIRLTNDASSFWEPISTKTENRRSWKKLIRVFFYLQFVTVTIAVFSTNDRHQTRLWTLHGKGINGTSPSK